MSFRIAVVQPIANPIGEAEKNIADAVAFIGRAKAEGADFVCFPETYPGPWRMPAAFDPTPRIAEAASKHGINTVYGTIEPLSHNEGTAHNLICMAYGDGRPPVSYRRTHPNGPWIYTGGKWWEFQYVPGNEFPVFDTKQGKVGLAMCSEAYMPEVTRALALRGAELSGEIDAASPRMALTGTGRLSRIGVATIASPRSAWLNRFCVVTTIARFSMERDQIRLRQLAHNLPLSVPAGMKISSAPRSASARVTSGM